MPINHVYQKTQPNLPKKKGIETLDLLKNPNITTMATDIDIDKPYVDPPQLVTNNFKVLVKKIHNKAHSMSDFPESISAQELNDEQLAEQQKLDKKIKDLEFVNSINFTLNLRDQDTDKQVLLKRKA